MRHAHRPDFLYMVIEKDIGYG